MRDLSIVVTIFAVAGLPVGVLLAVASTLGVAISVTCVALLLVARMLQAAGHHQDVLRGQRHATERAPAITM